MTYSISQEICTRFLLCCVFFVVIHWLIFPYPSGFLHWHCGNITIAPVPAKQPWWIWINTSCEFIMNDCITTTKQSTTKPCACFLGYTVIQNGRRHHRKSSWVIWIMLYIPQAHQLISTRVLVYSGSFHVCVHDGSHRSHKAIVSGLFQCIVRNLPVKQNCAYKLL